MTYASMFIVSIRPEKEPEGNLIKYYMSGEKLIFGKHL